MGNHPSSPKTGSDVYCERRDWGPLASPGSSKSDQDLAAAKQPNPVPTPSCLIQVDMAQRKTASRWGNKRQTNGSCPVFPCHCKFHRTETFPFLQEALPDHLG